MELYRIMFRQNSIQLLHQFRVFKRDMRGALPEVSDAEHLILIARFTLNGPDVLIQTNDNIVPVIGYGFAAELIQYPFQVGKLPGLRTMVQTKSPPVPFHQIVEDNLTAEFTG